MTRALRPVTFCNLTSHLIAALYSPNFHFQIFDLFQSLIKKFYFYIMSNYREMLEDYRDVDIDELMAGLTEEELKDFFK